MQAHDQVIEAVDVSEDRTRPFQGDSWGKITEPDAKD